MLLDNGFRQKTHAVFVRDDESDRRDVVTMSWTSSKTAVATYWKTWPKSNPGQKRTQRLSVSIPGMR